MKEHTEQHLDNLAKKVMKSSTIKSPSVDFTANVMRQIDLVSVGKTANYKPLISKYVWFGIIAVLIGVSIYMTLGNVEGMALLDTVDYSVISNNKITNTISGITFSKTLMYAIGLFGLVFFIQIPMMKYYLNKRLQY